MADVRYAFMTPEEPAFESARRLRWAVLRGALGCPYSAEWDDDAPGVGHLVAMRGDDAVGYGRLLLHDGVAQIRYVAVAPSEQGTGVGAELMRRLIARAGEDGAKRLWLNARFGALDFYRCLGFVEVGPFFDSEETGLPHKRMEYRGPL